MLIPVSRDKSTAHERWRNVVEVKGLDVVALYLEVWVKVPIRKPVILT